MDGLECSEKNLSIVASTTTLRLDSDYYKKEYLNIENIILDRNCNFTTIESMGLTVNASAFYPSLEPYYNTGEIPFIRVADVKTQINYEDCVRIPKMNSDFNTLYLCKKGDIVLTKGGSVGNVGLITQDSYVTRDLIFINSSVLERADYITLYLFFSSNFMYKQMIKSSSYSVQPHLTITLIRELLMYQYSNSFKKIVSFIFEQSEKKIGLSKQAYCQAEQLLLTALGIADFTPSSEPVAIKLFSKSFTTSGRLDAEYYQPKYDGIEDKLAQFETTNINIEFDTFKNSCSEYSESGEIGVVKTKQLTNVEINKAVESFITREVVFDNKLTLLEKNDVLFASMGVGSLGKVSIYYGESSLVTDSTLKIYRKKLKGKIAPEVLTLFFQSVVGQELIYKYVVGSTGIINIYDKDINKIPIPILPDKKQKEIATKVQESFELRHQSEQLLEYAKTAVEMAIEQGEEKAMEWLKDKGVECNNV